jgi:hypothetical protein
VPQQEDGDEGDEAEDHGEGVASDPARLQQHGATAGAGGEAGRAIGHAVDIFGVAGLPQDIRQALGGLDEITAALLAEGSALYDVVGMVKFDRVPKVSAAYGRGASCGDETRRSRLLYTTSPCLLAPQSYAHRYLLRDVAWLVSVMHGLTRICCVAASCH